jgi:hypothetical protein
MKIHLKTSPSVLFRDPWYRKNLVVKLHPRHSYVLKTIERSHILFLKKQHQHSAAVKERTEGIEVKVKISL